MEEQLVPVDRYMASHHTVEDGLLYEDLESWNPPLVQLDPLDELEETDWGLYGP